MAYPLDLEPDLRAQLDKRSVTPDANSSAFQGALLDSADAIMRHCHRIFVPTAMAEPRRFDARASALLDIDDLLATGPPTVLLGGAALPVAYTVQWLPYYFTDLRPHYDQVRLIEVATGQGIAWNAPALALSRPPTGDVTITGVWGYAATVPGTIQRMTVRGAARLWHQRVSQQGSDHGGTEETGRTPIPRGWIEQDDVMVGFLRPFVKD